MSDRLPGIGRGRTKTGRHRRALDQLAKDIRAQGRVPYVEALIGAARGHADACDRVERDPDVSEHTASMALSQYRQALADLRQYATDLDNTADPLADALAAAIRASAAT